MKKFICILILLIFLTIGCGTANYKTDTGENLSSSFSGVYKVLTLSKTFYTQSKKLVKEADSKGYLDAKNKKKIVTIAKKYKQVHEESVELVDKWYNQIKSGKEVTVRELAIEKLYDISQKGKLWAEVCKKATNGQIELPKRMIPNAVKLAKVISKVQTAN